MVLYLATIMVLALKVVVPLCQVGMRKTTTDDVGDGWHGPRVEGKKPEVKEPEDFWSFFY